MAEFSILLLLGLVSSLHCVQMCGPIVLAYSTARAPRPESRGPSPGSRLGARDAGLATHLAYNAGRVLTYTVLGGIAGALGGTLDFAARLAGLRPVTSIVAGCAMVLGGVALLGLAPAGSFLRRFVLPQRLLRPVGRMIASPSRRSKFALGLLLGLLPCGLVYAALLKAVSAANVFRGAMAMLGFGLGTTAALLVVGMLSSSVTRRFARWGTTLAAAIVILLGVLLIARGVVPQMAMSSGRGAQMHHH